MGDTIDGQSHAWMQAWTGGWWNYDPTNDKEINEQYISVGVGRDYSTSRRSRASTPARARPTSTSSWRSPGWPSAHPGVHLHPVQVVAELDLAVELDAASARHSSS